MKSSEKIVQEFIETFPGKCLICSFHRYGVSHGMIPNTPVADHECIEKPKETQ